MQDVTIDVSGTVDRNDGRQSSGVSQRPLALIENLIDLCKLQRDYLPTTRVSVTMPRWVGAPSRVAGESEVYLRSARAGGQVLVAAQG